MSTMELLDATVPSGYSVSEAREMPDTAASRRAALAGALPRPGRSKAVEAPRTALRTSGVRPSAAEVSAFAHTVGTTAGNQLPASYVHVAGFPLALSLLTGPEFPLPALGMVHIANRVRQARALHLGEELAYTAWAENLRAHRRGALIDVHVTADAGTGPVWHGVSTYLARGVEVPGEPEGSRATWERAALEAEGLHSWSLSADTGRRYAEVSGDANPIHTSRIGARLFGFPRPIAHGMYTASRALAEIGEPAGGSLEWTAVFGKPVVLPARVDLEFTREGEAVDYAVLRRNSEDVRLHLSGRIAQLGG
nr:hypothetical protein [Actinomycetales bacterium]